MSTESNVVFSHVIHYVPDVSAAIDFYHRAFGLSVRFLHESGLYAELETGTTALAFASEALGEQNLPEGFQKNRLETTPQSCEVVLTTEHLLPVYEHALREGGTAIAPPVPKPWGQTIAYLRDPQGILIELATPILKE